MFGTPMLPPSSCSLGPPACSESSVRRKAYFTAHEFIAGSSCDTLSIVRLSCAEPLVLLAAHHRRTRPTRRVRPGGGGPAQGAPSRRGGLRVPGPKLGQPECRSNEGAQGFDAGRWRRWWRSLLAFFVLRCGGGAFVGPSGPGAIIRRCADCAARRHTAREGEGRGVCRSTREFRRGHGGSGRSWPFLYSVYGNLAQKWVPGRRNSTISAVEFRGEADARAIRRIGAGLRYSALLPEPTQQQRRIVEIHAWVTRVWARLWFDHTSGRPHAALALRRCM